MTHQERGKGVAPQVSVRDTKTHLYVALGDELKMLRNPSPLLTFEN